MRKVPSKIDPLSDMGLPSGFRKCEYLESTGTQYILTDFPLNDVRVAVTAMSRSVINDNHIIGAYNHGGYYYLTYWSNAWSTGNGTNNIDGVGGDVACLTMHTFDLGLSNPNALLMDGVAKLTTTYNTTGMTSSKKLPIFARWVLAGNIGCGRWLIQRVQIKQLSGDTLHTLVPALDRAGTPCMYDTTSSKAYYNAGTGQFLYKLR